MSWNDELAWKPDPDLGEPRALHADSKALIWLEVREAGGMTDYRIRIRFGEFITEVNPGAIYESRQSAGAEYWAALHTVDALRRLAGAEHLQTLIWEPRPEKAGA